MSRTLARLSWRAVIAAALAATLLICALAPGSAAAHQTRRASTALRYQPGIVLVGFRPGVSPMRRHALERRVHARQLRPLVIVGSRTRAERALARRIGPSFVLRVPHGTVQSTVGALRRQHRVVRYAEPNYVLGPARGTRASVHRAAQPNTSPGITPCTGGGAAPSGAIVPNDPDFGCQWGSLNTGQTVHGGDTVTGSGTITGTPGDDDGVAQAWRVSTGSRSIVIGELDSGVDYSAPDLKANIWTNPGGIGGCAQGTRGFNVVPTATNPCDPMDDNVAPPTSYGGHGTHVAGILGAVGDNGIGIAGVNWSTTILPVKAVDSQLQGTVTTLVAGINKFILAQQAGVNVRIVNFSPVRDATATDPNLPALSDAIKLLGAHGILFVTAAGGAVPPTGGTHTGVDDDTSPHYPCNFDLGNEICVAGSNQNGQLASWSNYGPNSVDLAAPGDNVLSTLLYQPYGYISGVSMATPQVSGAAALILSVEPGLSMTSLKNDILGNVDQMPAPSSMMVRTGGTLDICAAMPGCGSPLKTATTVSCTPTSVAVGQTVTCTAAVRDTEAGIEVPPSGSVSFSDATGPLGACQLQSAPETSSGSCQITYTPTAPGAEHVTASYNGDATNVHSPAGPVATTVTVTPISTSTSVTCVPSSVTAGNATTCTATVGDTSAGTTIRPGGKVAFNSNSSGTLSSSTCSLPASGTSSCSVTYTPSSAGSQTITASYVADASHRPSSDATNVTVTRISTSTSVTCVPSSATVGNATTCTATVGDTTSKTTIQPGGQVFFASDSTGTLSSSTCSLATSGTPSCSVTYRPASVGSGTHHITASYGGDSAHASSAATTSITVTAASAPAPVNTAAPTIAGSPRPNHRLTCSTGQWANAPTSFAYRWSRNGTAIAGADSARYTVQIGDETTTLECVVTARNASGSSSAQAAGGGRLVAISGTLNCPTPRGHLGGTRLGPLSLGMTRAKARRQLPRHGRSHGSIDNFCLYGGWGINAVYPSHRVLVHVAARTRSHLRGRIVLLLTSNPHYSTHGVRPGTRARTATRRLKLHRSLHSGGSLWYVVRHGRTVLVVEVGRGAVQQIGIATASLMHTRAAQRRLLSGAGA